MRTSQWKEHVLDVLAHAHTLTLAEMHAKIPAADQSTLFRNAEQLVEEGLVKKIILPKRTHAYELLENQKKHSHFICTTCSEVDTLPLPRFKTKHTVDDVTAYGTCTSCDKKQ